MKTEDPELKKWHIQIKIQENPDKFEKPLPYICFSSLPMIFTSSFFLLFLACIAILNGVLPSRFRWVLLLLSSLFFYTMFVPAHTLVLLFSVVVNYFAGIWIDQSGSEKDRKKILAVSVLFNVVFLAGFKLLHPLMMSLHGVVEFGPGVTSFLEKTAVPVGISFYTFTAISYLIEVKRRTLSAEIHPGFFSVYLTFFPKLIQGPIERPQRFLPQLREERPFDEAVVVSGLRLILWGLFKKMVIADRLALAVNPVYDHPGQATGGAVILATLLYTLQIYADFSGFIDIARGAGHLLGFDLSRNFNRPYSARSIKDFWSRWHITLSNWLRDYIFLPLAFALSRKLPRERYFGIKADHLIYMAGITVTFVICGIWHGLGWTFFIWGALYAFYLIAGRFTEKPLRRVLKRIKSESLKTLYHGVETGITFLLVSFAFIFFRANTLTDAFRFIGKSFEGPADLLLRSKTWTAFLTPAFTVWDVLILAGSLPVMFLTENLMSAPESMNCFSGWPRAVRWACYYSLLIVFLLFKISDNQSFIYFRF